MTASSRTANITPRSGVSDARAARRSKYWLGRSASGTDMSEARVEDLGAVAAAEYPFFIVVVTPEERRVAAACCLEKITPYASRRTRQQRACRRVFSAVQRRTPQSCCTRASEAGMPVNGSFPSVTRSVGGRTRCVARARGSRGGGSPPVFFTIRVVISDNAVGEIGESNTPLCGVGGACFDLCDRGT